MFDYAIPKVKTNSQYLVVTVESKYFCTLFTSFFEIIFSRPFNLIGVKGQNQARVRAEKIGNLVVNVGKPCEIGFLWVRESLQYFQEKPEKVMEFCYFSNEATLAFISAFISVYALGGQRRCSFFSHRLN